MYGHKMIYIYDILFGGMRMRNFYTVSNCPISHYNYAPMCNFRNMWPAYHFNDRQDVNYQKPYDDYKYFPSDDNYRLRDQGKLPYVVNINQAAKQNNTFRTAIWTGDHLQVTLMAINVGEDIGLEVHPDVDQFLRIEEGQGFVQMGNSKNHLNFERYVADDSAIMVPAGTWHNITNIGQTPLKLYSIYAPPEHPFGTIHKTKADDITTES